MMKALITALGLTLFFCAPVAAAPTAAELQSMLDTAREEAGAPGMALAVWTDGGVAAEAVSGERAAKTGVAVEKGDPWHLGSNTKAMTAVLAARLMEQGRLERDLTVGEALGGIAPDMNPAYGDTTFAELLTHRSGLPANGGMGLLLGQKGTDESRDARADRTEYAQTVLAKEPSEQGAFLYSNAGYIVAAAMIEETLDADYDTLMRDEVFGPLGLDSAGFGPPGSMDEIDTPRGHKKRLVFFGGPSPAAPDSTADNPPAASPAGRAHMNLADYLTFVGDQMACGRGAESRLISAESCEWLQTPNGDYAMGWGVSDDGRLSHAGSNTMWFVRVYAWPEQDFAVVAAANDGRIEQISPVIAGLLGQVAESYGVTAN